VDGKNRLMRVLVSAEVARSTIERRDFWRLLKSLTGVDAAVDVEQVANDARVEVAQKIAAGIMSMATGAAASADAVATLPAASPAGDGAPASGAAAPGDYEPVWIETPECTACDECVEINPRIFAYNDQKQAYIVDPKGGAYKDIVRAAEKCTAGVIHPGTPFNPNETGVEKLVKRAAKYQ
jgi:pyruvate-ferredoxin/flavodoxin oxidoreductase